MSAAGAGSGPEDHARIGAIIAACVVWGSSFLFGKVALDELAVVHVVFARFALATAVLLPLAVLRHPMPAGREVPLLLLTGFLGVPATFLLQFEGLARTTVTSASLIVGTGAALLGLAGWLFRGERPGRRGWSAVGLSTAGVCLVVGLPAEGGSRIGDLLVLASMVVVVAYILLSARLMDRMAPIVVTGYSLALGCLTLLPLLWLEGIPAAPPSGTVWAALLALGLACTAAAYALWNWGLARVPSSRAGIYINLEPLVGAILGVFLLGDPLTGGTVAGGGLILGAAVWISIPKSDPARRSRHRVPGRRRSRRFESARVG